MSAFSIKKATRSGVNPLIGLYSESGCGKTFSSLLLARGLVGPKGKIVLIDTESGRGSLYADEIPGGYDVLDMCAPFSPVRYREAMKQAISGKADCIVVDSFSHEWEAVGGVQDTAMEISQARSKKYNKEWDGVIQFGDWKQPKMEHVKTMIAMLQSPVPIIVCLRSHYKSRQVKDGNKTEIVKDKTTSPIQSVGFIFEMTVHAEIDQEHRLNITKCPINMKQLFEQGKPITLETGARLAQWCQGGAKAQTPTQQPDALATLKKRLWEMTKEQHKGSLPALETWLTENGHIDNGENLSELNETRLATIIEAIEETEKLPL